MLAVAIGCGLLSMLGIRRLFNKGDTQKEPAREIIAARLDIPAGIPLNEYVVHFVSVPENLVPQFAVISMEELEQRSLKPANAGEWILTNKLADNGQFGATANPPEAMSAAGQTSPGQTAESAAQVTARTVPKEASRQQTVVKPASSPSRTNDRKTPARRTSDTSGRSGLISPHFADCRTWTPEFRRKLENRNLEKCTATGNSGPG